MACPEYPTEADDYVMLSNRQRVRIRLLRRGEDGPIRELWQHLSPRSRYLRFFSMMSALPDSLVSRLVAVDDCKTLALVAEHESGGTAIVVGLVNLGAVDDARVEVGLVVRDDWQQKRLGTELATRMMLAAERRGFRSFVGHVLEENVGMRKLLKNIAEIVSMKVSGNVRELAFIRRSQITLP